MRFRDRWAFFFEFAGNPEYSAREGHRDLFGTDTRPSRDEVQKPQEGERISSEIFDAPGDRDSEEPGFDACLHVLTQARGRISRLARDVAGRG